MKFPAAKTFRLWFACGAMALTATTVVAATGKPKIAVFSGPTATIQNNEPLVTSNKAREQYGLPLRKDADGHVRMDWPRYQRIAAPVTVYIEMFTAHPLEADVKEIYAAPDGYVHTPRASSRKSSAMAAASTRRLTTISTVPCRRAVTPRACPPRSAPIPARVISRPKNLASISSATGPTPPRKRAPCSRVRSTLCKR